MQSNASTEARSGRSNSWTAAAIYIALILAAVAPVVLTSGWFEAPDVGYGVTYLLFAWFWAMFSAIAGISSHFGLAQPIGWFSFVVAPIFSGMWMLFALMSLNVL